VLPDRVPDCDLFLSELDQATNPDRDLDHDPCSNTHNPDLEHDHDIDRDHDHDLSHDNLF